MAFPYSGIIPKPPTRDAALRKPEVLAGGAVPVTSTMKLRIGEFVTLVLNSKTNVACAWSSDSALVALTTDVEYAPSSVIPWEVDEHSQYVSVVASDGATAFTAWLFRSS